MLDQLRKWCYENKNSILIGIVSTVMGGLFVAYLVSSAGAGWFVPKTDINVSVVPAGSNLILTFYNNDYYAGKDFQIYVDWLDLQGYLLPTNSPENVLCKTDLYEGGHGFSLRCDYIPPKSAISFMLLVKPSFSEVNEFNVTFWSENTPIKKAKCPISGGTCVITPLEQNKWYGEIGDSNGSPNIWIDGQPIKTNYSLPGND